MKKILMLATTAAMIEQFNKKNIELLNEMGYIVDAAGNFQQGNPVSAKRLERFSHWIRERGGQTYDIPAVRSPAAVKSNLRAYRMVFGLLQKNDYLFIHVHTPIGSMIGRLAAHRAQVPVIYTAHGFHFYHGAAFQNWLLYYPAEWLCAWRTDVLITINREDFIFAKLHLHAKRIFHVPGVGIDTEKIFRTTGDNGQKRKAAGIPDHAAVILSVGELNQNKNHADVLRAMSKQQNDSTHYVICGKGSMLESLNRLAQELKIEKRVHILGFRDDVMDFYQMSDIFAFPSKREGLPLALMEAMAAGLPCVCYCIRGNVDLIEEEKGGYLVETGDINDFAERLDKLAGSKELREHMGNYNKKTIKQFDISHVNTKMQRIYEGMTEKRVLHFLKTGGFSGAENVVVTIIKEMKKRWGYEGIYVSVSGDIDAVLKEYGIEHAVVTKAGVREFQRVIDHYRPDIIHAHDFSTSVLAAMTRSHALMISHLHSNPPWIRTFHLKTAAYAWAAGKYHFVLGVSESVFEDFYFRNRIKEKEVMMDNPVDSASVAEKAHMAGPQEASDVIFLGRLASPKNPIRFLELMGMCRQKYPDIKAFMIGDGALRPECEKKIRDELLNENVKLLGFQENPYGFLKGTKVLCMPSVWEGFGLAVAEAFALGIPVIATPVGGMQKLVTKESGFLSDKNEELCAEILRLLTDRDYYQKKSDGAWKRAEELDNLDAYTDKLRTIYETKRF